MVKINTKRELLALDINRFFMCFTQVRDCHSRYYNPYTDQLLKISYSFGIINLVTDPEECYKKITNKKLDIDDLRWLKN